MRPTMQRDADRLLGHAAAAKLSALNPAAVSERTAASCAPILPWALGPSLGRVGCRFSGMRADAHHRATVDRPSPQPYLSLAAIRSWVL